VTERGTAAAQTIIVTACRERERERDRAITRPAIRDATVITGAKSTVICGMCLNAQGFFESFV
jgi:hypothetical protein